MATRYMILHRNKSGNAITVITLLFLILSVAILAFNFMTHTDVISTTNLYHEVQATYLAESIATQIEALANRHPWDKRFWLLQTQKVGGTGGALPLATFDKSSPYIRVNTDIGDGDFQFDGVVKDLAEAGCNYRIYVEVIVRDEKYAFCWDKKFDAGLLGGLNQGATHLSKGLDKEPPNTRGTDAILNSLKLQLETAPPPGGGGQEASQLLTKLAAESTGFRGQAITPDPGAPKAPTSLSGFTGGRP
jgi:hypothetical protein